MADIWRSKDNFTAVVAPEQARSSYVETSKHRLGTKYEVGAQVFVYAKAATAAAAAGFVYSAPLVSTQNYADCTVHTMTVGDTQVTVILPSVAGITAPANTWNDGWVYVVKASTAAAEGSCYQVKSHTTTSSTAGTITLTLYDPVFVAVATAQTVNLAKNVYNGLVLATSGDVNAANAIGACQNAVTAAYYGWFQTRGPGVVQVGATALVGKYGVILDATTAGAVIGTNVITSQAVRIPDIIGVVHGAVGAAGDAALLWYKLN